MCEGSSNWSESEWNFFRGLQSWEKRNPFIFWPTRLRETKPTYFQCELAEGRINFFRVVRRMGTILTDMVFECWGWGKHSPYNYWSTRPREAKPKYFRCKLAEGRIKIFHGVRLRETTQMPFLCTAAEGSVAQTIFSWRGWGKQNLHPVVYTGWGKDRNILSREI